MDNQGLRIIGVVLGSNSLGTHRFGPKNTYLELSISRFSNLFAHAIQLSFPNQISFKYNQSCYRFKAHFRKFI